MSEIPSNPYDQPPGELIFSPDEPEKKPRGCLFYGCITLIVIAVLGLILIIALSFVSYNFFNNLIKEYTSTTPVVLPQVTLPQAEEDALVKRYDDFKTAVDKGEGGELILTADEINALINRQKDLKGKVYITIKDDKITGQLSLPLDWIPFGMGKGRFLNGKATLTVELFKGVLIVQAKELEVNGKTPDPNFMKQFESQNLAKDFANDPKNAELLRRFDSIEIKDGKIHLKAHAKSEASTTDEPKAKPKDETEPKPEPKAEPEPESKTKSKESNVEPEKKGGDAPQEKDKDQEKKAAA